MVAQHDNDLARGDSEPIEGREAMSGPAKHVLVLMLASCLGAAPIGIDSGLGIGDLGFAWRHDEPHESRVPKPVESRDTRNPFAVGLSKLGASKGGHARAAALSPTKRRAIAKKAVAARWGKKR